MSDLSKLVETAFKKAASTGKLDDLNKAAQVAKAAADADKANSDVANSRAQIRLEGWKSFATFLVPVVSLLTVAFTVWIQVKQLQQTQVKDEDTEWREFLKSINTVPGGALSDPTFEPRLRSFFSSDRYGTQAISISKRMMGQIANANAFRDLFSVTFGSLDSKNFRDVIDVNKSLHSNIVASVAQCVAFTDGVPEDKKAGADEYVGLCARSIAEKAITGLGLDESSLRTLRQLRRTEFAFEDELYFVGGQIAEFLRANYSVGSTPATTTMSLAGAYLGFIDLSNVDFSSFDITDTAFDGVTLSGAKLTPRKVNRMDMRLVKWWAASEIEQKALEDLVTTNYPYYAHGPYPDNNAAIDRKQYESRIRALCIPFKDFCKPENLKFGP